MGETPQFTMTSAIEKLDRGENCYLNANAEERGRVVCCGALHANVDLKLDPHASGLLIEVGVYIRDPPLGKAVVTHCSQR